MLTPTKFTSFEVYLKFMETGMFFSTFLAVSAHRQEE